MGHDHLIPGSQIKSAVRRASLVASILLALLCVLSCTRDRVQAPAQSPPPGLRLTSIEFRESFNGIVGEYTDEFRYDEADQLIEIIGNGRRYDVRYRDQQIHQVLTYSVIRNELIFRDSFVYGSQGKLEEIYGFNRGGREELTLDHVEYFLYQDQKVVEKVRAPVRSNWGTREKYFWDAGRIARTEYYEGEELLYEFYYTYDDQINYRQGDPRTLSDPPSWSANNMTSWDWVDHYGNFDVRCRPCTQEFTYNDEGYPVMITGYKSATWLLNWTD